MQEEPLFKENFNFSILNNKRKILKKMELKGSYLGPSYSNIEEKFLKKKLTLLYPER